MGTLLGADFGASGLCRSVEIDQLRTDVVADVPDNLVTPWNCVSGQAQSELVGDIEADRIDPYAAIRHVGDEAVPRRVLLCDQGGEILDAMVICVASFRTHRGGRPQSSSSVRRD